MTERCIDVASEGDSTAPFLIATDKVVPSSEGHVVPLAGAAKRLGAAPTERLKGALNTIMTRTQKLHKEGAMVIMDGLPELNFEMGLMIGAELTGRKVPPIFRSTPFYCSPDASRPWWHDSDSDLLALMLDLQWVVCRHRPNRGAWESAAKVYDPAQFRAACRWLHWNGRRSGGQVAKALALSEAQQFELTYSHALYVARQKRRVWALLPVAQAKIMAEAEQRQHDRRDLCAREETAKRRSDLWLCGALSGGRPQRSAEMYAMLTGQSLARSIVARHLEKMPDVRQTHTKYPS